MKEPPLCVCVWGGGGSWDTILNGIISPLQPQKRINLGNVSQLSRVVYHLHKDSSISEWKINGTHIFGRPNRKITGINGLLEKVVLFDRLERFKRFISFHLHFFWIVVLVPNKFIICFYSFRRFRSYSKWKAHTPKEIFQLKFLRSICTISNQMVFACK